MTNDEYSAMYCWLKAKAPIALLRIAITYGGVVKDNFVSPRSVTEAAEREDVDGAIMAAMKNKGEWNL